jgi:hypothetical protein
MNDDQDNNSPTNDPSNAQPVDPSVNDVLAQQMGTDYDAVENADKQELQQEINDQGVKPEDIQDNEYPEGGQIPGNS